MSYAAELVRTHEGKLFQMLPPGDFGWSHRVGHRDGWNPDSPIVVEIASTRDGYYTPLNWILS